MKVGIKECPYPMVSICCATYNHVLFIRQCLDGFVMQKTKFPIEILIHDDASTDGTQDIIREYEAKYPNIIKPIYQKENQYSKGVKVSLVYNYSRVKGKYIALCEGDDYWTDPYKLQKQVDFLESHPDYVMCSHRWSDFIQLDLTFGDTRPKNISGNGKEYNLNDLIYGRWFYQPVTVMFRHDALDWGRYARCEYSMDIVLFYELLRHGKGFCLFETMAVYRTHQGGTWTGSSLDKQRLMEFKAKLAIYNIERTKSAALFLLSPFTKVISRIWMIKQLKMFVEIANIFAKYFGLSFTIVLFVNKLLFNKRYVMIEPDGNQK